MAEALTPGSEIGGYRIESVIGRGGMAIVYRAEDLRLGRRVALKLLPHELAEQEQFRERFIRESRLAASLDHPNIIPIYEAGEADDRLYIAMRLVVGSDLKAVVEREGVLSPARTANIMLQVADALDAAHALGLVHRDVKPGNIMVTEGRHNSDYVYLTDFGLTKRTSSLTGGLTGAGHFLGTTDYVAPEQITGKLVDGRADIYALGCVLYECLTGQLPFRRDDDAALLWAHLVEAPPPPTSIRPELPAGVDDVIERAMSKSPEARYPSCLEMVRHLEEAIGTGQRAVPSPRGGAVADVEGRAGGVRPPSGGGAASRLAPGGSDPGNEPGWQGPVPPPGAKPGHPSFPPAPSRVWSVGPSSRPEDAGPIDAPAELSLPPDHGPPAGAAPTGAPPSRRVSGKSAIPAKRPVPTKRPAGARPPAGARAGSGQPPRRRRGVRRRTIWLVLLAALVVTAGLGTWLLTRGPDLSQHVAKSELVAFAFDSPADWGKLGPGVDVVFSPSVQTVGPLFTDKGTVGSWDATRQLLTSNPNQVLGLYTTFSFTQIDRSSTDVEQAAVTRLLPPSMSFASGRRAAVVGGAEADALEGDLWDPSSPTTRLHMLVYVVQEPPPDGRSVVLAFFAAPDRFDKQRPLFEKIIETVRFS